MRARLALGVRVLLVLVGLSPFLPALLDRAGVVSGARALDAWFHFQCERDPLRMLAFGAVCARCLGLYVGLGLGALVVRPRLGSRRLELWLALAALAMLADVGSEWLSWRPAWAPLRFGTGFALGYPAGIAVLAGLATGAAGVAGSPASSQNPSEKPAEG